VSDEGEWEMKKYDFCEMSVILIVIASCIFIVAVSVVIVIASTQLVF